LKYFGFFFSLWFRKFRIYLIRKCFIKNDFQVISQNTVIFVPVFCVLPSLSLSSRFSFALSLPHGQCGMSALHEAARCGDVRALAKLLKKKTISVNHQLADSLQTPLHVACTEGRGDAVKCLMKAGANPNLRDCSGWTPLHCASKHGHLRVCESLLLSKLIDPTILTIEKTNALYYLVRYVPKPDEVSPLPLFPTSLLLLSLFLLSSLFFSSLPSLLSLPPFVVPLILSLRFPLFSFFQS
jgi:hypothetical protein